jgi:hypothetical protein
MERTDHDTLVQRANADSAPDGIHVLRIYQRGAILRRVLSGRLKAKPLDENIRWSTLAVPMGFEHAI